MIQSAKPKKCRTCGNDEWKQFNTTDKFCSWKCAREANSVEAAGAAVDYRLKDWSMAVRTRDGFRCKRCGKDATQKSGMDAHHVKMKSTYPQFKYDLDNGICLCRDCHRWVHDNPKKASIAGYLYLQKYQFMQAVPRDNILEVL